MLSDLKTSRSSAVAGGQTAGGTRTSRTLRTQAAKSQGKRSRSATDSFFYVAMRVSLPRARVRRFAPAVKFG
jgi:hypothetical protein